LLLLALVACDPSVGPLPPASAERAPAIRPIAGIPDRRDALDVALSTRNPVVLGDTRLPRLSELSARERRAIAETLRLEPVPLRVATFLFLQLGTPYEAGSLGEEIAPDTDPLIDFRASDCVVLNLTSWAAAMAVGDVTERAAMIRAHYRDGIVSHANRFHFSSDRLDHSPMNREITARVGGAAVKAERIILNRKPDGARWIPIDWERERVMRWIPWSEANRLPFWRRDGRIPELTGIVFVKSSLFAKGLDALHEGNIWRGETVIHASSRHGRVVAQPLEVFLREAGARYDGFLLFEYRE
jgi:hypothetical protein